MEEHSFGYWLRLRRKALDLTQDGLADRVGCSVALIRKIESEERRPSEQITQRIADIFNIPQPERSSFLKFARGDWKAAPTNGIQEAPWRVSTKPPRSNIPAPTTSLIAREKEIALIREYLSKEDIRLVTLMGPPGIGKTRLGMEAARASLSSFPDGVFFVALAPLEHASLIATTILQLLDYTEAKNQPARRQLADGIGEKQMLIILDNCEHLIQEVSELVSELLSACPGLKFLTTSRESFRIPGEWLYTVPPLDVLKESASMDVETASTSPALTLFAERARAVRSDFVLDKDNIQAVASVCAQLDGLPLAIELIAARMRIMSPQTLLAKLNDQFILYADGMRALSARQKTLHNAIEWSYNLLSAEEQDLFARLSVFSGGFTLEAAESIFSQTVSDKPITVLITSLLDKSLLQRTLNERGEPRFNMMVTLQQFALNRLRQSGEEMPVRNWHLLYFFALAEQADKEIHGPNQIEWMDRIEAEHDNFRAALDWCISSKQTELTLRLFNGLGLPWLMRNRFSEIRGWFNQIRALSEVTSNPGLYARTLNVMGRINWLLSDFQEAQSLLDEARAIWLSLHAEGERGLAEALDFLGLIAYSKKKDLETSRSLFEESLELYQKHEDQWGIAFVLSHLGMLALTRKDTSLALSLLKRSMDLFHHLGDIWGKARVLHLLGVHFLRQGDYEKARFFFEQNLRFDQELRFKPGMVVALINLGDLHRYQRDYSQASQYYEEGVEVSRTYGINENWGLGLYLLGLVALHQNDYSTARQYFADHFRAEKGAFDPLRANMLFLSQAAVFAGTNQLERSARLSGAAQGISERLDYQISHFDYAELDRHIQIAREQLGEAGFEVFANEGRHMTMEQAIAYALEEQGG